LNSAIRVALADDQALVRHGLRATLERACDIDVLIDVESGSLMLERLAGITVDIVVVDIRMPLLSGIEVTRRLRSARQATPILLLTTFDDPELVYQGVAAGANGYLLKDVEPAEFVDGIRLLVAGGSLFSPVSLYRARSALNEAGPATANITKREAEVLRLIAAGYSNKEIGRVLAISDGTVKNRVAEIMAKLEARDRTHAVLRAIASGVL
jgi:DNA-binding NarL/FixJ family response regulator